MAIIDKIKKALVEAELVGKEVLEEVKEEFTLAPEQTTTIEGTAQVAPVSATASIAIETAVSGNTHPVITGE